MKKVPSFPIIGDPGEWDELTLLAATIFLEASGEPSPGQIAVGAVVMNRAREWGLTVHTAILGKDGRAYGDGRPFEQFSCFNEDYAAQAAARLAAAVGSEVEGAWRAAAAAIWRLVDDPSKGATFYLNPDLTRKIRPAHDLPSWFDPAKVTAVIGRHTFVRA